MRKKGVRRDMRKHLLRKIALNIRNNLSKDDVLEDNSEKKKTMTKMRNKEVGPTSIKLLPHIYK